MTRAKKPDQAQRMRDLLVPQGDNVLAATVTQLPGTSPAPPPKKERNVIDLERMKLDYEADRLTTREIGKLHKCSHGRVSQLAGEHGWKKDLRAKIRAAANLLLNGSTQAGSAPPLTSPETVSSAVVSSETVVQDAAQAIVAVRRDHRSRLATYRALAEKMCAELMRATDRPDILEELGLAMWSPDQYGHDRLNETYMKIIAMPGRIKGLKDLADVLKTLIGLERQAWDLDAPGGDAPPDVPPDRRLSPAEHYKWLCGIKPAAQP